MFKHVLFVFLAFSYFVFIDGKLVHRVQRLDKTTVRVFGHRLDESTGLSDEVLCIATYNNSFPLIGWDLFEVQTNPQSQTDEEQANCAGLLEGLSSWPAIYDTYYNNVPHWCDGREDTCRQVYQFLEKHLTWLTNNIAKKSQKNPIWHQVSIFYNQLVGMQQGYSEECDDPSKALNLTDFLFMNLLDDLEDVAAAVEGDTGAKLRGDTRCSAIVKLLPDNQDLLVGHNTWTSYNQMVRSVKKYWMPTRHHGIDLSTVPGFWISFSGYPGIITSGDDFYTLSSGLVAQETTIGNYNATLWNKVKPTGQLFESMRTLIAHRLATDGRSWCKIFSQYNSGTYNNQWMIVDYNKFKPGKQPGKGTLWILEQIPGYVRYEDKTNVLTTQTYWPSYNVPYYQDVFDMAGNQQLVDEYGDWFTYNNTPRALIFKKDQSNVTDLPSLLQLLRSNNYKHDPYSQCNCTPPYSAENAIAARSDLNLASGSYPFPALGHRPHGAIDAKVTSADLARKSLFLSVSGPTRGTGHILPAFSWSKSDFNNLPHLGQPDSFDKFQPIVPKFTTPFF